MSAAAATPVRESGAAAASLALSVFLHAGILAAFLSLRSARPAATPPIYRVNIIAAAPGPAAAGLVNAPTTPVDETKPPPPRPKSDEIAPVQTKVPRRQQKIATPGVADRRVDRNAPAPKAAGGEEGGRGADVANVRTEGVDFPYPGYLENIVRQIALRFKPPRGPASLKAEVMFLIKRDGTISGFRFMQRSGSFAFDLEAQGAIEVAGQPNVRGQTPFGPLPSGFREDVLPVMFSFDPRLIR
jgi:protein TonB